MKIPKENASVSATSQSSDTSYNSLKLKHERRKKQSVLLLIVPLLTIAYSFFEPYWYQEKNYIISSSDIPEAFDNTRIVFLADIHHGPNFSFSRLKEIVNKVNRLEPDLVLLGGDYVEGSPVFIEPCLRELGTVHSKFGVFGVLGNHDHWQDADLTREAMKKYGITSIDNQGFWIQKAKQKIRIGGVGDHCEDYQNLSVTIDSTKNEDFVILVSHSPDYAADFSSEKVDLMLSGHTHGGQITFFGLFAPKVPSKYGQKYRSGMVMKGKLPLIISNGIGTVYLPLRFFSRPQILIITLISIRQTYPSKDPVHRPMSGRNGGPTLF